MNYHGLAYKKYCGENPDTELTACCDVDNRRAREFAEKYKFKACYDNYREMLDAHRPNVVCITASYSVISDIAVDVMSLGYPVMIEKPPGASREECVRIIEKAKATGLPNQVAFNRRFTPIVNTLKNLLNTIPMCNNIHNIRCDFQRVERKDNDFFATAIHGIDTVRYLAGSDYKNINLQYQELPEIGDGVANIYLDCVMESGATAQLSFCPCGGKVIEEIFVTCRDNHFALKLPVWRSPEYPGGLTHFSGNKSVAYHDGGDARLFGTEMFEKFGFYDENATFFNDIKAGRMPVNDISSALQSLEIAECIHKRLAEYRI